MYPSLYLLLREKDRQTGKRVQGSGAEAGRRERRGDREKEEEKEEKQIKCILLAFCLSY